MKRLNYIILFTVFINILFINKACLPDTYHGPDPIEGSIVRFYFDNADATVIMGVDTIYATLPRNTDLTTLVPIVLVSLGSEFINFETGLPADFSSPVSIELKGTDNVIKTYTIIAEVADALPGFANVKPLFEIRHENLAGAKANDLKSMAISGDKIILLTGSDILYFDANNGNLMGSKGTHHGFNRLATDSLGRIIGSNAVSNGSTMRLFRMDAVEDDPVEIFSAINTADGQFGNGAQINIYGDLDNNAIVFAPIHRNGKSSQVYKWVIDEGEISSTSPEIIEYIYTDPEAKPYGNIGFAISAGPNSNDGYIFGDRAESSYFQEGVRYIIKPDDIGLWTYGGPGGGKVFTMNGAKYFALWRSNLSHGGLLNIMDISNPAAIAMSREERGRNRINFLQFESETFRHFSGFGNNVSMRGSIDVKYLQNGNVILYFMYDNSGIIAYELIKDIHFDE